MKKLSEKGIVHIIPLLIAGLIIVAIGWFLYSRNGLEIGKISIEDKIASLQSKPFKDVSLDNKNYIATKYLAREGVLKADQNGNFNPESVLTRSEWAVVLVKLAGVEPDQSIYKNCYTDIGEGEKEAAICYAKEQEWFSGNFKETSRMFIRIAIAQESGEKFNSNEPLINLDAAGSLARMMVWEPGKDPTNEEALQTAKTGKMFVSEDANNKLTRADAVGFVFRSLATVPFNQYEYDENFNSNVTRYKVRDLVTPRPAKSSTGPSREARIKHWAENSGIGVEVATAIVDSSSSYDEEIKKVRQVKYQRRLEEEERATGQKLPSYDAFEPIKQALKDRGIELSKDDVIMKRGRIENDGAPEVTTDPVITARDNFKVRVMLNEDYQIVPKSEWDSGKIKHVMEIFQDSFYDIGQVADFYLTRVKPDWVGQATIQLIDYRTAEDEKAVNSEKWYRFDHPKGLPAMFKDILDRFEVNIGRKILPPAKSEKRPTENSDTEEEDNEAKDDEQTDQVAANDIIDICKTPERFCEAVEQCAKIGMSEGDRQLTYEERYAYCKEGNERYFNDTCRLMAGMKESYNCPLGDNSCGERAEQASAALKIPECKPTIR